MQQQVAAISQRRSWLRFLVGVISFTFVLPVPAYAAYVFSAWTITQTQIGTNTSPLWAKPISSSTGTSTDNEVTFTPLGGHTVGTGDQVIITISSTLSGGDGVTHTPSGNTQNAVDVVSGNALYTVGKSDGKIFTTTNQFSGFQAAPTYTGHAYDNGLVFSITYTFNNSKTAATSWTAPGTAFSIIF